MAVDNASSFFGNGAQRVGVPFRDGLGFAGTETLAPGLDGAGVALDQRAGPCPRR